MLCETAGYDHKSTISSASRPRSGKCPFFASCLALIEPGPAEAQRCHPQGLGQALKTVDRDVGDLVDARLVAVDAGRVPSTKPSGPALQRFAFAFNSAAILRCSVGDILAAARMMSASASLSANR